MQHGTQNSLHKPEIVFFSCSIPEKYVLNKRNNFFQKKKNLDHPRSLASTATYGGWVINKIIINSSFKSFYR